MPPQRRLTARYPGRFFFRFFHHMPLIAEELWKRLGHDSMISNRPMPAWDEALCIDATITLIVQVNGKKRGELKAVKMLLRTNPRSSRSRVGSPISSSRASGEAYHRCAGTLGKYCRLVWGVGYPPFRCRLSLEVIHVTSKTRTERRFIARY